MKGEGGWLFTRYIQVECITIIYKHTWKNSTFKQSSKLKSNLKVIYRSCKHTLIQDVTQTKLNNLSPQLICALKSVKKKVRVEDIILVWILPFRSLRQRIEFTGVGDGGACSASWIVLKNKNNTLLMFNN